MQPNNYLKLSVRAPVPLHDAESVRQAPSSDQWPLLPHGYGYNGLGDVRLFVTSWVFPFNTDSRASAIAALEAAQAKRKLLRTKHFSLVPEAFQLASFEPSGLRGVPVVGDPVRQLNASELGELEVVS